MTFMRWFDFTKLILNNGFTQNNKLEVKNCYKLGWIIMQDIFTTFLRVDEYKKYIIQDNLKY